MLTARRGRGRAADQNLSDGSDDAPSLPPGSRSLDPPARRMYAAAATVIITVAATSSTSARSHRANGLRRGYATQSDAFEASAGIHVPQTTRSNDTIYSRKSSEARDDEGRWSAVSDGTPVGLQTGSITLNVPRSAMPVYNAISTRCRFHALT